MKDIGNRYPLPLPVIRMEKAETAVLAGRLAFGPGYERGGLLHKDLGTRRPPVTQIRAFSSMREGWLKVDGTEFDWRKR